MWGHNVIRDLEIVHMRYLRLVLCVHRNTCNNIVYGELGIKPIDVDIKVKIVGLYLSLEDKKN